MPFLFSTTWSYMYIILAPSRGVKVGFGRTSLLASVGCRATALSYGARYAHAIAGCMVFPTMAGCAISPFTS